MKMAIEHIRLDETHFTFIDGVTGNEAVFYIAQFDTHIDTFDPATLHFNVPVIKIDGVKGHVYQTSPLEIVTTTQNTESGTSTPKTVFLNLINQQTTIQNVAFDYSNEVSGIKTSFHGTSLDVFPEIIDMASNLMAFRKINMKDMEC